MMMVMEWAWGDNELMVLDMMAMVWVICDNGFENDWLSAMGGSARQLGHLGLEPMIMLGSGGESPGQLIHFSTTQTWICDRIRIKGGFSEQLGLVHVGRTWASDGVRIVSDSPE